MKNFVDLKDYLIKEIKPQKNYQFFILKELLNSEGSISYKELAKKYDKQYINSTKETTEQILKNHPTQVLNKHKFIESNKNTISLNIETQPEYYKNSILWILDSYLDHWDEFENIKNIRFKENIYKSEEDINNFCGTFNIPVDLVQKIISSINRGEKQIILDGPPGTGKTYLLRKIIEFLSEGDSLSNFVQFHPSYGYEEFIEGLRPTTKDTGLNFEVKPGILKSLLNQTKSSFPLIKFDETGTDTEKIGQIENDKNLLTGFSSPKILTEINTKELPEEPGVHLIYYENNLLYVGETGNTRRRIAEHMRSHHASGDTFIKHSQKKFQLDLTKDGDKKIFDDLRSRMTIIYKITENKENLKNKIIEELKPEFNQKLASRRNDFNRKILVETWFEDIDLIPDDMSDDELDKWLKENPPQYELTIDDFKEVFELQKSYSSRATKEMQRREEIVKHELPNKIQNWLNESGFENYKVAGKGDQGMYSKAPWVRVFREEYSSGPSDGYYIVYLFDTIGERVYLSLNRGSLIPGTSNHIPDEEARKSVKEIREIIKPYTDSIEEQYTDDDEYNIVWEIDLAAEDGTTPAAYEKTHIFGYEINKNQDIGAYNADFIDMLELLDAVYKHLDSTKEVNIESLSLPREPILIYNAMKSIGGSGTIAEILEEVQKVQPSKKSPAIQRALQQYTPVKYNGDPMKRYTGKHLFNHVDEGKYELANQNNLNTQNLDKTAETYHTQHTVEQFGNYDFLLIDEINRGNLPKIFGEMLNAFEYRDEKISLQYSEEPLTVPSNLIFLGTMNSTDKSVGRLDSALRRRFDFIHVEPNYDVLENFYRDKVSKVPNLVEGLQDLNDTLEDVLGKHCLIGHTFFMKDNDQSFTYDDLEKIWRRKIYPLLEEYFMDDLEILEEYDSYKNFWTEIPDEEQNQQFGENRYTKDLLSEHLAEISLEHKSLQLEIEEWSEKIEKIKPYIGWNNVAGFRSGGRTFQYWISEKSTGRYDLFKLAGNGFVVLPIGSLKTRPPFNSFEFFTLFQEKLKDFIENFDINVGDNFYSKDKPRLNMKEIIDSNSLNEFLSIWEWVIKEIEKINNLES